VILIKRRSPGLSRILYEVLQMISKGYLIITRNPPSFLRNKFLLSEEEFSEDGTLVPCPKFLLVISTLKHVPRSI